MRNTKRVGLIGWPVEHSVSPEMHNMAFQTVGLHDWHYELLPTPPEELEDRIRNLVQEGFVGANVTIPHKQAVIPHLDRVALAARSVGAVNTILIEDGQTEGHNTDVAGFLLDFQSRKIDLRNKRALVLGAGGSARAVVLALSNKGVQVTVVARREQAAWDLRQQVRGIVSRNLDIMVQSMGALGKIAPEVDLIVNCTPVGMWPNIDESPWPNDVLIPSHVIVYDLIYRPRVTRLMQQARASGAKAFDGLGMLVHQGVAAFELWTGQQAPVDIMWAIAAETIEQAGE